MALNEHAGRRIAYDPAPGSLIAFDQTFGLQSPQGFPDRKTACRKLIAELGLARQPVADTIGAVLYPGSEDFEDFEISWSFFLTFLGYHFQYACP